MNAILARPAIYIYICINKNMSIVNVTSLRATTQARTLGYPEISRFRSTYFAVTPVGLGGWGLAVVGGDPIGNGLCQQFRPRAHLVEFKAIPYRTPSTKTFVFKAGIAIHDLLFLPHSLVAVWPLPCPGSLAVRTGTHSLYHHYIAPQPPHPIYTKGKQ